MYGSGERQVGFIAPFSADEAGSLAGAPLAQQWAGKRTPDNTAGKIGHVTTDDLRFRTRNTDFLFFWHFPLFPCCRL